MLSSLAATGQWPRVGWLARGCQGVAASGVAGGSGGSGGVRVRDVLGQPRELRGEVDGVLAHHGGQLAVHLQGGSGVEVPRVRGGGGGAQGLQLSPLPQLSKTIPPPNRAYVPV